VGKLHWSAVNPEAERWRIPRILDEKSSHLGLLRGGIAELAAINALGEGRYVAMLNKFRREYIEKNERFARNRFLIPAFIRLRAYKHTSVITQNIDFIMPELEDPVQFVKV
jgi:hypothetical protein